MEIGNKYSESTIGLLTKDKLDLDEIRVTFCENQDRELEFKEANDNNKKMTPPKSKK